MPLDIEQLEEAFVRLHALERRMPGGGKWPFAGDGPWHLIQGEAGDYAGDGADGVSDSRAPRPPLDQTEVAEYERVRRWMMLAAPAERALLWAATGMLHRGEPRPAFGELRTTLKYPRTPRRLAQVYTLAMWRIVASLNGKGRAWAQRKAVG